MKNELIPFPPVSFRNKKWGEKKKSQFDVIIVTGDAYVDHPSFASAVICRRLEQLGLTVAIIAQPDWKKVDDFKVWGKPRLFFMVSAGAMDSMVSNYSATRMPRCKDRMSPDGEAGLRPKRAVQVYAQKIRESFGKIPIVIGGIEASLRRFVHYDFWEDKMKEPILMTASADILLYGMVEAALKPIVEYYSNTKRKSLLECKFPQTCIRVRHGTWEDCMAGAIEVLPSVKDSLSDKKSFIILSKKLDISVRPKGKILIQQHPKGDVICFPPSKEDLDSEMGILSSLKFNRSKHPIYDKPVPALEPVLFSIQSHRGCLGACTFCALSLHQGRYIRSKKVEDILAEAKEFVKHPKFKGIIPDVGGPAVNMFCWSCKIGGCKERICTHPDICPNLNYSLKPLYELLTKISKIQGVRKVFLGSGLRYDLVKPEENYLLEKIILNHISGQLKVAPEHFDKDVLGLMRKAENSNFEDFIKNFNGICKKNDRKMYLIPYFILSFPGSSGKDSKIKTLVEKWHLAHNQVQEFTPTPGSLATAMYATELDLRGNKINVKKNRKERLLSRQMLQRRSKKR